MPRREKILRVTPDWLVECLKHQDWRKRLTIVENPLPDDARFVRAGHDIDGTLLIVIASETFEEIGDVERRPAVNTPYIHVDYVDQKVTV